jgi:hypothetical protein
MKSASVSPDPLLRGIREPIRHCSLLPRWHPFSCNNWWADQLPAPRELLIPSPTVPLESSPEALYVTAVL